jgi:hypothetical protein
MDPVENERKVRLSGVLRKTGPKLIYTYHLGDSWEQAIALEKQLSAEPNASYTVWTDGQLVNSRVRRMTEGAFQNFMISLRLSPIATTNSTKN